MFLGNEEKVYILDKVEGNAAKIQGHSAWAAVWDIASSTTTLMDMTTNTFCASGMHLPNGSFATFGGNKAIGPQGADSDQPGFDSTYDDSDGGTSIRILNPCTGTNCQWFDNANLLSMQQRRWYAGTEALADGSVVLIGGFVNGGYVNRNLPNNDPTYEGGGAEPTFEFFPARDAGAQLMQFMTTTSGLNSYAHAYLMPSGQMFVQANLSTILWDYNNNIETPLPKMPHGVVRVYPASGAVAMLPLTPANNYTPSILFCGGSNMPADAYGDYLQPKINTFYYPASNDCQRITPEPQDGSAPEYVQDDDMLEGRTMGQFIILPTGKLLILNGGSNGTAGYATATDETPSYADMPYGMSLAAAPVLTPAIYDPDAPAGSRWSRDGIQTSQIPRLYHSSALLLPDASVIIAGSNPNVDVNLTTFFPTTYTAERFYPPYFSATTRPVPQGVPAKLSYGGAPFDIQLDPSSYTGDGNDAAGNTTVVIIRPGFTTHAMNMGQRFLQLNNTFTVMQNGTILLHVSQVPPNPNLITPGPVLLFVVVDGIPSNGTMVIVGNGKIGSQPTHTVQELPAAVTSTPTPTDTPSSTKSSNKSSDARRTTVGIGALVLSMACALPAMIFLTDFS
ncbi:glyoxal oxidase [Sistotremastrum suecicum HHB10207 ss-3]|uniref:Glyoxal oxidase n=1 Tax=Sistotremastrum suecicum HHB10207 ss-3 TaxID=1314776 RepID=A0A166CIK8_9AGAM|nr:glyoxal oxidase [Sistotremastrum suecicum HHB10207 ss-3]